MTLFMICLALYMAIGLATIPMFMRSSYKSLILEDYTERDARMYAGRQGWAKSIVWPVTGIITLSQASMLNDEMEKRRIALDRAETERILKEDAERDPVNQAFQLLEKENKLQQQQEIEQAVQEAAEEARDSERAHWEVVVRELQEKVDNIPKQLNQEALAAFYEKQKAAEVVRNYTPPPTPYTQEEMVELLEDSFCNEDPTYHEYYIRHGNGQVLRTVKLYNRRSETEIIDDLIELEVRMKKIQLNFNQLERIFNRKNLSNTEQEQCVAALKILSDEFQDAKDELAGLEKELNENRKIRSTKSRGR